METPPVEKQTRCVTKERKSIFECSPEASNADVSSATRTDEAADAERSESELQPARGSAAVVRGGQDAAPSGRPHHSQWLDLRELRGETALVTQLPPPTTRSQHHTVKRDAHRVGALAHHHPGWCVTRVGLGRTPTVHPCLVRQGGRGWLYLPRTT